MRLVLEVSCWVMILLELVRGVSIRRPVTNVVMSVSRHSESVLPTLPLDRLEGLAFVSSQMVLAPWLASASS